MVYLTLGSENIVSREKIIQKLDWVFERFAKAIQCKWKKYPKNVLMLYTHTNDLTRCQKIKQVKHFY